MKIHKQEKDTDIEMERFSKYQEQKLRQTIVEKKSTSKQKNAQRKKQIHNSTYIKTDKNYLYEERRKPQIF